MIFLGIDLGTSSVKVIAINQEGELLGETSREYEVNYPKVNWAEQNPEEWWNATKECIKDLTSQEFCKKDLIKSIGFSGQMHGMVILDKNNNVLHPALLWCDQRTQEECDEITNYFGKEKLTEYTSNKVLTGFTAPKLLWIKKYKPKIYAKIAHIMLPKDYIRFKLTGKYATDFSDASGTLLLNVSKKEWSEEVLKFLDIDENVLPELHESWDKIGYVKNDVKMELDLKEDIVVAAGAGDQAAGAVGTGTIKEGIVSVTLGTSGVVFAAHDTHKVDIENRLHAFCHANGKYHSMGVILSAASCLKWWVEEVNRNVGFDKLLEEAENAPEGSNGLFFLPYLIGERTPYPDPSARGCFIGLTISHSRGDMTRAILEGVAYALRDSLDILKELKIPIHQVRINGGGSKSRLWNQILSDILNSSINILNTEQGGALGAAILAGVSVKGFNSLEEACDKIIRIKETFYPDYEKIEIYNSYYEVYKKLYNSLKDIFYDISLIENK